MSRRGAGPCAAIVVAWNRVQQIIYGFGSCADCQTALLFLVPRASVACLGRVIYGELHVGIGFVGAGTAQP